MTDGPPESPTGSVVVPVLDGGAGLGRCLDALHRACPDGWEVIVVDDGSVDGSGLLAERRGVRVIRHPRTRGPAAARNTGAAVATGEWLCFVDADCVVHHDAFGEALTVLAEQPSIDALFGSYDDTPADPGLVSQFKNLHHHFVHHRAGPRAVTFWSGLGFVRRSVFLQVGGFDATRYARPSVEDIDLGYRLTRRASPIRVAPTVRCTHLKRWTLRSALRSDLCDRGVPWARLLRRHRVLTLDLNLRVANRASVVVLYATAAALLLAPRHRRGAVAVVGGGVLVALNQAFYRFLVRVRGPWFVVRTVPLHWGYYAVNGLAVVLSLVGPTDLVPLDRVDHDPGAPPARSEVCEVGR